MAATGGLHRLTASGLRFVRAGRRAVSSSSKVVSSEVMDLELPGQTFHQMCWSRVETAGQRTALVDGVRGESYSLAEARTTAAQFARGLVALGGQPGEVVAVLLPNMPEFVIVMLGASEAGMVVTTLNPAYTAGESKVRSGRGHILEIFHCQERSAASWSTARPRSSSPPASSWIR